MTTRLPAARIKRVVIGVLITAASASMSQARAEPIIEINDALVDAIRDTSTTPPPASRDIAMVDLAMYNAVDAASGLTYQPLDYTGGAVTGVSANDAAYAAGYSMMGLLFPTVNLASVGLAAPANSTGSTFGTTVADNLYALRATDGSATAQTPYTYGTGVGAYQSTSSATQPLLPGWGSVKPFVLTSGNQFLPPPPPAVGTAAWIAAYNQVLTVGCTTCGTPQDQEIARFWSDVTGTETPPGHWLTIVSTVAASAGLDLLDTARLSAMVGTALSDASVAGWDTKYTYNNWRPITAIRNCTVATCGVAGDPTWQSLWPAPNFPGYVSGHSTYSAAAATALAAFFGTDDISFCSTADPNAGFATPDTRCFTSFSEAAAEAGESRILGGIHFEFDNTAGLELGDEVGSFVVENAFAADEPTSLAIIAPVIGFLVFRRNLRVRL
jgi:hypothetical protein